MLTVLSISIASVTCNSTEHNCTQVCAVINNTIDCSCRIGYSLAADQVTCEGTTSISLSFKYSAARNSKFNGLIYFTIFTIYTIDKDECVINPGICAHNCINTPGSYYCSCRSGFQLSSDGTNCQGYR